MKQWISIIKTNQKAAYVIRNIAVGTEPLFDSVMTPAQLAKQINTLKSALSSYGVQVTLADVSPGLVTHSRRRRADVDVPQMPYSFQQNANAPEVFAAVDTVSLNVAPFFNNDATTAAASWHSVAWNVGYGKQYGLGKTVTVVQTGWPSNTQVWPANSPNAVASVQQEQAYYDMLNGQCNWFKAQNVGWFSHSASRPFRLASGQLTLVRPQSTTTTRCQDGASSTRTAVTSSPSVRHSALSSLDRR